MKNFPYAVPEGIKVKTIRIKTPAGKIPMLVLQPEKPVENAPGVLWIHGGGYFLGMKEMVYIGRGADLVLNFGATVLAPGYHLSILHPYPAALEDCYAALLYLKENAETLGYNKNQLMIGGESAGGGLTAALAMYARDKKEVNIAYQMPLYPMIDNQDTESSIDNHGKVWNTRNNHLAWKIYLRGKQRKNVSPYAAPARQTDYTNLPPAYTFVGDGEPFYCETLNFVENLKAAGIHAQVDVYKTNVHGFDMGTPASDQKELAKEAIAKFNQQFGWAVKNCFAEN